MVKVSGFDTQPIEKYPKANISGHEVNGQSEASPISNSEI